jgi:heme a synthase
MRLVSAAANSHFLLRLRLLQPPMAAIGFLYVLWMVRKLSRNREESSRTLPFLTTTLFLQIVLGVSNVLLLAPLWLQVTHLFVAEIFWILLVLASADVLLKDAQHSLKIP